MSAVQINKNFHVKETHNHNTGLYRDATHTVSYTSSELSPYPVRVEFGLHTRYHTDRFEHELVHIKEGFLVHVEAGLKLDLLVLQDQMQHKARVLTGSF